MKILSVISLLILSNAAIGAETKCEGWYQTKGAELKKTLLSIRTSSDSHVVYSGSYEDISYNVDWDKNLTTFYVRIEQAGNYILGTTARVPTDNHPENFTDLHIPNGLRLAVNCEMK